MSAFMITIIAVFYIPPIAYCSECDKFQNDCVVTDYDVDFEYLKAFICPKFETKFELGFEYKNLNKCASEIFVIEIFLKSNGPTILGQQFDLNGLYEVFKDNVRNRRGFMIEINLGHIVGFDVNSFNKTANLGQSKLLVTINLGEFVFYSRSKRIKSCEEYYSYSTMNNGANFFQACSFPCTVTITRFAYPIPICPLAFNNTDIKKLRVSELIDTFYKTNTIRFLRNSNYSPSFKCSINDVLFAEMDNVNIDETTFNLDVFKNTEAFTLDGKIGKIQTDLFSSLSRLKQIQIKMHFFQPIIHKQGIEWIEKINMGLNYNLSGNLLVVDRLTLMKSIEISVSYDQLELFQTLDINYYFPDEDFCLYFRFPFHQLVFFNIDYSDKYVKGISCTLAFLLQYHPRFFPRDFEPNLILASIQRCDFNKMRSNCNKSIRVVRLEDTVYDIKARMMIWQFVSILISPVICLLGTIGNVLVIVVTSKKTNEKSLKENQYLYMKLKSIANCFILLIQIFSLLSDCQSKYTGIYCSSIYRLIGVQYFKIVFNEFFSNYFRFLANLFHLAFAFNRLSLIGKKNSKFTEFLSKMKVWKFFLFSVIIGLLVTFVKGFRTRADDSGYSDYESSFVYANDLNGSFGLKLAISILNCLCDLLNGPIFVLFCIVIDIHLVVSLKRTTDEKLAKLSQMSSTNADTTKTLLKNAVFRTILMAILNSLVNVLLKTPSTIMSIIELVRFIIGYHRYSSGYNGSNWTKIRQSDAYYPYIVFFNKCELLNTCQAFEEFSKSLFMISIGIDVLIYYNFDKKFKEAFSRTFSSSNNTKNEEKIQE